MNAYRDKCCGCAADLAKAREEISVLKAVKKSGPVFTRRRVGMLEVPAMFSGIIGTSTTLIATIESVQHIEHIWCLPIALMGFAPAIAWFVGGWMLGGSEES